MSLQSYTAFAGVSGGAGGVITAKFSDIPITGEIISFTINGSGLNNVGSLYITASGINSTDVVGSRLATFVGGLNGIRTNYPFVYPVNGLNETTGSPQTFFKYIVNSPLQLIGSAVGAGSIFSGLTILWNSF